MRYKVQVQYDGTDYSGWQIQPNATTIQEELEKTFSLLLREQVRIIGSGRTDAGVHALEQVAHFDVLHPIALPKFLKSVNHLLPDDIRVLSLEEVPQTFHAQYGAKGKIYHYHLWLDGRVSPFLKRYRTHIKHPIELSLLRRAAPLFLGTHDFSSFANQQFEGSAGKNPIRTLTRVDVIEQEGGLRIEFEGDGFLYKMVRNIVGMLLEIASGARPLTDISLAFEKRDRTFVGKAAPATGLFLVQVHYDRV